jgi:predicted HTH transcriptional regulator
MSLLLSRTDVQNLDYESLLKFIKLGLEEGAQVDYKEALSGTSKKESYKEFLKDISAFANAHGGLLIVGVKEPDDGLLLENQIVGITDGVNLSKDLERVAATSIDPRIPGLLIKTVQLPNNTHVIIVFIPPSMNKPHMVSYKKHRSFYIRHSASSVPMTAHEIRDTVLSSATSEGRARSYAETQQFETSEYLIKTEPGFLIKKL